MSKEQPMKVYKVNDYEWWAGPDVESVKAACQKEWGKEDPDAPWWDDEYPAEITPEQMVREKVQISGDVKLTFAELLQDMLRAHPDEFPCFFAAIDA
jgi:hypothetical protein